jgi:pimeloyl-ACP methyl ester carboxylesterase
MSTVDTTKCQAYLTPVETKLLAPTPPSDPMTDLPPALPGRGSRLSEPGLGALHVYAAEGASVGTPLVLIHSVNAAASAAEVRPLYEHFGASRPTYALDLPGFGGSDRSDRPYTPRLMTEAIHAVVAHARERHGGGPVDALALSLSCEFLARAANERPDAFRTLALVSPTGFDRRTPAGGPPGSTRGMPLVRALVSTRLWSDALFETLTKPKVIRYFLERTWGSEHIDEALWAHCVRTARAPGAKHAPLCFLSGFLFSKDVRALYDGLRAPVWMTHGVRGDFVDYRRVSEVRDRPEWRIRVFETGALPFFEVPDAFVEEYRAFLDAPPGR